MAAGCCLARPDVGAAPTHIKPSGRWRLTLSPLSTDAGTLVPFVNSVKNIIFVVALGGYFLHDQLRARVAI